MERFIEKNDQKQYDVIVIGGGITGAAVAYDAASRGLSVALLEKNDFGWATSSATSKLIHGGLRYLATFEYGLVRESLRERKTLENIAPNFVHPIPIMIAESKTNIASSKAALKIAMLVYDMLSFDKKRTWDRHKAIPCHRSLSVEETLRLEPNVKKDDLAGSVVYYDCASISPERLTLAFIKSAVRRGARVANYARVDSFVFDQGHVSGVRGTDLLKNREFEIRGSLVINCGGPWADIVLGYAKKKTNGEQLRRSEGIHIITRRLVNDHIVTSITKSGRHFFVIPWRGYSLIGTTDKEYIGNPDTYRVTKESIMELLAEVNESFGNGRPIVYEDIIHAYGGLRPLVEDQTKDVYESSRKYEIYDNAVDGLEGLITVEGGKYTTSRNLAENVMKMVSKKLKRKLPPTVTDKEYLAGSEIEDIDLFFAELEKKYADFPERTVEFIGRTYGREADTIFAIACANRKLAAPLNEDGEMLAQVVYAVREEMAKTLGDIVFRRTGLGTLGTPGEKVLKKIAETAARELKWSEARMKKELAAVKDKLTLPMDICN